MPEIKYTTQKHREWVIKVLTELQSDSRHIKEESKQIRENLEDINSRVIKAEQSLSFIQGIGSVITVIFGALFTFFYKK